MRHGAVGLASNERIEQIGIIAALGLAARRAIDAIRDQGIDLTGAVVLLDGSHDWLSPAIDRALPVVDAGQSRPHVCRGRCGIRSREGAP